MIEEILSRFAPISLGELGDARLMDRIDRKYLIPRSRIGRMLAACTAEYRVLEVGGVRLNRYVTRYFDTPELSFYHAHHNERLPRTKVRMREYIDSGVRFMELKRRSNKGRTVKSRVALNGAQPDPVEVLSALPDFSEFAVDRGVTLVPVLDVSYFRITLVRCDSAERVTIDIDIRFEHDGRSATYPDIAFVELKQDRRGASPFLAGVRAARIREGSISKYCLGIVSLVDGAKKNRFKRRLYDLNRIAGAGSQPFN